MLLTAVKTPLLSLGLLAGLALGQETGNHPDWPRWCGKVYKADFDPGGQAVEPSRAHDGPLLHIQVAPRFSLYLDSETHGEFVVRTTLSPYFGAALPAAASTRSKVEQNEDRDKDHDHDHNEYELHFSIELGNDDMGSGSGSAAPIVLVHNATTSFSFANATSHDTLVPFALAGLTTGISPQNVTLHGWIAGRGGTANASHTYTATSRELVYLADPGRANGSITRLDNAYGGFWFRSAATTTTKLTKTTDDDSGFEPFFPYGFFASDDGFLANATDTATAATVIGPYAAYGINAMTPLAHYPTAAAAFTYMQMADLRFQFDLREHYTNLSWVTEQAQAARGNAALFAYWSADEPDGHQDPFAAPRRCRDAVRAVDPYHPVAVVLNCQDYYFDAYTEDAADVIMADVYPVGINASFSKWGTPCNATLGDCGCDNCRGGRHAVRDVADRLDDLARYEAWLPARWPRTKVHNPQSFHGEGYWARSPSAAEEWAMALVALNHGAQGLISWVYPVVPPGPDPDALPYAHGRLAQVLTRAPVRDFVVGHARRVLLPVLAAVPDLDVACWRRGDRLLVSIVNSGYDNYTAAADGTNTTAAAFTHLSIPIPPSLWPATDRPYHSIDAVLWGDGRVLWSWAGNNLSTPSIPALSTSLIVLSAVYGHPE